MPAMERRTHAAPGYSLLASAPCVPSVLERKYYYHGIHSKPPLIARSSTFRWEEPTGPHVYLPHKECIPLGQHPLKKIWKSLLVPALDAYLMGEGVLYTSLDPLRIGTSNGPSPAIIWMGVKPGSLTSSRGIKVALDCRSILIDHAIDDVHVEIREAEVSDAARMFKPVMTSNPLVRVIENFSTSLGISICSATTPYIEGTGTLIFTDPRYPGKYYLLTARHNLFHPDNEPNELYVYREGTGQPRRNVLLLGDAGIKASLQAIEDEIECKEILIKQFTRWLKAPNEGENEKDVMAEKENARLLLKQARDAIKPLEEFRAKVVSEWMDPEKRIIGHVILSPPIGLGVGDDGYTEDLAVVELGPSIIDSFNFNGNAVDLGTTIAIDTLTTHMRSCSKGPSSLEYPRDRLLRFSGTLSNKHMERPEPDHDGDRVIMVLKHGRTTGLTVGRLNDIRSVQRRYFKNKPSEMSNEVAVFPRSSKSGAFSDSGDSGAAVISGTGQVAGMITAGVGLTEGTDCTYVTPISFILERLEMHGIKANIFPMAANLNAFPDPHHYSFCSFSSSMSPSPLVSPFSRPRFFLFDFVYSLFIPVIFGHFTT